MSSVESASMREAVVKSDVEQTGSLTSAKVEARNSLLEPRSINSRDKKINHLRANHQSSDMLQKLTRPQ